MPGEVSDILYGDESSSDKPEVSCGDDSVLPNVQVKSGNVPGDGVWLPNEDDYDIAGDLHIVKHPTSQESYLLFLRPYDPGGEGTCELEYKVHQKPTQLVSSPSSCFIITISSTGAWHHQSRETVFEPGGLTTLYLGTILFGWIFDPG